MELLYKRLANLLAIDSLLTLAVTIVFCVLSLKGFLTPEQVMTVFTVIVSFYFGSQAEKKNSKKL